MIAYKGFNQDMTCTMGHGRFKYEVGKTYEEGNAKCASKGFHCVEEPIEVLRWYRNGRYCMVEAGGDINEDGDDKIACTKITILKEITLQQLAVLECEWIIKHPDRNYSTEIKKDSAEANTKDIVIVRGKNPKAAGGIGATIFLLQEERNSKKIKNAGAFEIDGVNYMADVYYMADGRRSSEKRHIA